VTTYKFQFLLCCIESCFEQADAFAVAGKTQCWIEFQQPWQWQMYMTVVAVSLFVVPTLIISGCYTIIVLTIWSKSKTLAPSANRGKTNTTKSYFRLIKRVDMKACGGVAIDFHAFLSSALNIRCTILVEAAPSASKTIHFNIS
jgi:uncharacterized protein YceK